MNLVKRKRGLICIKEAKKDVKLSLIWLYGNSLQALFQVLLQLQLKGAGLDFVLHHLPMLALRPI